MNNNNNNNNDNQTNGTIKSNNNNHILSQGIGLGKRTETFDIVFIGPSGTGKSGFARTLLDIESGVDKLELLKKFSGKQTTEITETKVTIPVENADIIFNYIDTVGHGDNIHMEET